MLGDCLFLWARRQFMDVFTRHSQPIGIEVVVDPQNRHVSLLPFAQSLLTHMGIKIGELGSAFHKVQHLVPADAITVPEMLTNRAYHFQILDRVQNPAILAVIRFIGYREHLEQFRGFVQIGRNVYLLILYPGNAPGPRQGVCGKHFNAQATRVSPDQ
jgi:hypothetical protein